MAAPTNMSKSFLGTCSLGRKKDVNQKSNAPPVTLNVTMSMPVRPWVMASLPSGAISPQKALAKNILKCAISGRLFVIFYSLETFIGAKVCISMEKQYICTD